MKRVLFLLLVLPGLAFAEKPDLLLITIDTLRADHLGSYGHPTIQTPNLDALARKSLLFENAIAPAPLTLPSHTSLLTGRYPFRHGIRDNAGVVHSKELTLAEILRTNGYHTYAFVGGFPLDHRFGLNQGFEVYDDRFPRERNQSLDFRSERPADQVVKAVVNAPIQRPFFVWVHFYDPHTPYRNGGYKGEIEFVDKQIGLLLRKFESSRPVVAVAGDHGESLGEHGEWTHRIFVYDSTMRVPFWIYSPSFSAQRVKTQVRLVDFFPTVLMLLKIQVPGNLDGVVLPKEAGKSAYLESKFPQLELGWSALSAIRTEEWKYIQAPKPELYHLKSDPAEKQNVLTRNPEIVKKLSLQIPKNSAGSVTQERSQISPEMAEELASLGYISGSSGTGSSNIDPKDRINVWNEIEKAVDLERARPAEAVAVLERALKFDPKNPMILGFLAQKYAEANRLQEAKNILTQVLAREPKHSLALYRMASVCLRMGAAAEAKKYAETLRQLEKGNTDALILLARANIGTGNFAGGITNLKEALVLDPRDIELRNDLANLHLQMKQSAEAEKEFQTVLRSDPKNVQALNGLAMSYFSRGDLPRSEEALRNALRTDSQDAQTKMNLALLYAKQGRKTDAIALYRQVQTSNSSPPDWKEEATRRLKELEQ